MGLRAPEALADFLLTLVARSESFAGALALVVPAAEGSEVAQRMIATGSDVIDVGGVLGAAVAACRPEGAAPAIAIHHLSAQGLPVRGQF